MDHSIEAYCKLVSLCAYVLVQPTMVLQSSARPAGDFAQNSNQGLAHVLLEEAVRVRKAYDYSENPTLLTVYTSFFIFSTYFCMDRQNAAWVYLREATTVAHIMGMHEEDTYKNEDYVDASRKRRLFWVLFMTERAYAFKRHRPLTLYDTIQLPTTEEDPTETLQLSGFFHLIKLYKPFDETFFGLWNRTRHGAVPSWLVGLQRQLSDALPEYIEHTETQAVDLKMSQQWLKTMVWQLAISHGFISSMASDNTLSFRYPIEISRDLVEMSNNFSQHAMEVHGIGLVEKLFDVACTLIDVMSFVPMSPTNYDMSPRDYLNRFISLISGLRGGQSRLDVYNEHSQPASASRSNEATPFETPPAMTIRQHMPGMTYQDPALSTMQGQMSETGPYPSYSSSTHLPRRPGFPG
ncbi:hypothetical protein EG328_009288 [Venturia inaequalis]|uniref:Xylanolytic transcriptional activator regulatory domain-containing protein n=1 Tax=Venturia inaequalis TaxID=5025 RepID=A0A8H3V9X1_VENIN|nr:hypothetical protein EG328_009288 [Venturia inaequalis]